LTPTIFLLLAGLMGAGGIMLAAAGAHAHAAAATGASAGYMLLFHAAAVVGGAALLLQGVVWRPLLILLAGWVLGAALFSGDLALRAFTGHRLFAMAAPAGGIILIAAWLALAAAALAALWRG
jgi:uncharacterized membrane protein YgdD (TMEM256/DUF423 family)